MESLRISWHAPTRPPHPRRAVRAQAAADPLGVRGARRLQARWAPAPPGGSERLPAFPCAAARAAGPCGQTGAASRARRARNPGTGAPRRSPRPGPWRRPAGRASFVTVSSPSEPARHRRCARGCKWRPLASAPPAALPARGRLGAQRPGRIPPPPPGEQSPRRLRPRRRPQRGLRARARLPRRPARPPPARRAATYRGPRRNGGSRARAGGKIPGSRRGKFPLSKPFLCAPKQVAPT